MAKIYKSYDEFKHDSYEFQHSEYLKDIDGYGFVLKHKKSGARVCLISCDDDNKVFFAGFRTTPKNSTGVPHIIEHTVLCGSEKYPVKDPFAELCKASLNTFMNAFTYPDKTVYPIASCNDKDFNNLMSVYMDAVFHPNIYKNKPIFMQEGWRYELESPEDELKVNGVVYSEMRGVFSDPEQVFADAIENEMFPDNTYSVCSGGDPKHIPELTYQDFLDFHSYYYHPSNSYIFLYGDMDLNERLEFMDREYFANYTALPENFIKSTEIAIQKPFGEVKKSSVSYNMNDDGDEKNASYLSVNMTIAKSDELEKLTAVRLLKYALFDAQGAPVKQALIDAGIGEDIEAIISEDFMQPYLSIIARNAEVSQMDDFVRIIREELTKQVTNGIDKNSLRAALNHEEFAYKEADFGNFPKGLIYGISILETWLYDDEKVLDNVKLSSVYEQLKSLIDTDYYEKLVREVMLESKHELHLTMSPKKGLLAEEDEALKKHLAEVKASMTDEEIQKVISEFKGFKEFQETADTPEALATIPRLSLDDIKREIIPVEYAEKDIESSKLVFTPSRTSGIVYFSSLFDLGDLDEEEVKYASLLSLLLMSVSTEKYSFFELSNEINIYSGGMAVSLVSYGKYLDPKHYRPMIGIQGKTLYKDLEKALELVEEILLRSDLTNAKRVKEILAKTKARIQSSIGGRAHSYALKRAMSHITSESMFKEITGGITFYRFIEGLLERFDSESDVIIGKLDKLYRKLIRKEAVLYHVTAEKSEEETMLSTFAKFHEKLPAGGEKVPHEGRLYELTSANEALVNSGMVQFVIKAGSFVDKGETYNGSLIVLKNIIDNTYLYENVRLRGGAYGVYSGFSSLDGTMFLLSYRDPKLTETIDVYNGLADFTSNFEADEETMTGFVIGALGMIDTPLTPVSRGERAFNSYLTGLTEDILRERRNALISTTVEDIRALAKVVRAGNDGVLCVAGGEKAISEHKELFDSIEQMS